MCSPAVSLDTCPRGTSSVSSWKDLDSGKRTGGGEGLWENCREGAMDTLCRLRFPFNRFLWADDSCQSRVPIPLTRVVWPQIHLFPTVVISHWRVWHGVQIYSFPVSKHKKNALIHSFSCMTSLFVLASIMHWNVQFVCCISCVIEQNWWLNACVAFSCLHIPILCMCLGGGGG